MAKIIQLDKSPDFFRAKALIYGEEREFVTDTISKLIEKILHRDKHETQENVELDLAMNYSLYCPLSMLVKYDMAGTIAA